MVVLAGRMALNVHAAELCERRFSTATAASSHLEQLQSSSFYRTYSVSSYGHMHSVRTKLRQSLQCHLLGACAPVWTAPPVFQHRHLGRDSGASGHHHLLSSDTVRFNAKKRVRTFYVEAMSSSLGAESVGGDDGDRKSRNSLAADSQERIPAPSEYKGSRQSVVVVLAILVIGTLAALALIINSGQSPSALASRVSKSGFLAAFSLIFVSELGDKTFFIAALLAMRYSKWLILLGASSALAVMTVISVIIGKLFQRVPAQLQTTLPVGEYAAIGLLIWFGLRSIKTAWDTPSAAPGAAQSETGEPAGELAEAEAFLKQSEEKKAVTPLEILAEAFTLIFVAEWGDRSMLATIALGAAQSPWGVASGAIAGHVLATLLAIIGGALLSRYLSEKVIGYVGGFLFLGFAAATSAGVF